MKFENEKLGCSFSIPDRPTVRQQLQYFSEIMGGEDRDRLERYWLGARAWITEWQCEVLPDYKADLDALTNPNQMSVVLWAGLQVFNFYTSLENIPPNS